MSRTSSRRLLALTILLAVGCCARASAEPVPIEHLQAFRTPGFPVDVLVGPDANLWVLDDQGSLSRLRHGKVTRVTPRAQLDLDLGRQMTVDAWGRFVFITRDRRDRYVVRRAWPDGRFSDVRLPTHRDSPAADGDIVAAPGRGVWFSWLLARRKSRLALSGKIKEFVPPQGYPERLGHTMDVGPDGNLWANTSQGVARFTPKGRYLPPIPVVIDDPWPRVDRIARGSDDAMYAGVDQPAYMARIDPADGSIVRHVMIPGGESGGSPFDDLRYWAMAPGPGALIWPISGFINYTAIDEIISDTIDPVGQNGRLSDRFLGLPDLSHPNLETVSPEHFGLVAGLDGRMWFTERLTRKLQAWRSPWSTASPRGRARIIRTRKVERGRWLRVELGCTGTTGGYCVGSLQLRAGGRAAGKRVRYAVAAGPSAVQSRSARWLRISRRIAPGPLTVSHRRSGRQGRPADAFRR